MATSASKQGLSTAEKWLCAGIAIGGTIFVLGLLFIVLQQAWPDWWRRRNATEPDEESGMGSVEVLRDTSSEDLKAVQVENRRGVAETLSRAISSVRSSVRPGGGVDPDEESGAGSIEMSSRDTSSDDLKAVELEGQPSVAETLRSAMNSVRNSVRRLSGSSGHTRPASRSSAGDARASFYTVASHESSGHERVLDTDIAPCWGAARYARAPLPPSGPGPESGPLVENTPDLPRMFPVAAVPVELGNTLIPLAPSNSGGERVRSPPAVPVKDGSERREANVEALGHGAERAKVGVTENANSVVGVNSPYNPTLAPLAHTHPIHARFARSA